MRRRVAFLLACLLVVPAAAVDGARADECAPNDPVAAAMLAAGRVHFTDEPDAGTWRTWFDDAITVPAPPPFASVQGAADLAAVGKSFRANHLSTFGPPDDETASAHWIRVLLDMVKKYSVKSDRNPPRISRQIAMFTTAVEDALVHTWRAKYCYMRPPPIAFDPTVTPEGPQAPSYPSEHATVAGVAAVMFSAFFPEEGSTFDEMALARADARVEFGLNYPSDIEAGLDLGRQVALKVLGARSGDGANASWNGSGRIIGRCNWEPTPPAFAYPPAEPMWGKVVPWLMTSGGQFRPAPPPACDGDDYTAAVHDLYEQSKTLTDRQKEIADYWAGGPGTETPPGMNLHIAFDATERHGLGSMRQARVLAYVGSALADAAIAAWDAKYAYWSDRPVTAIRRSIDRAWNSYIGTPPFPGYVSGHATFSGAAAETLAHFFPDEAVIFRSMATEAAMSRYYGGIHVRYDNEVGLSMGASIADLAIGRAQSDGAERP